MPEKQKSYARVIFPPEVLMEADHLSMTLLKDKDPKLTLRVLEVDGANEKWAHDDEAEFFADYRKEFRNATFRKGYARTTDLIVNVALNYDFFGQPYYVSRISVQMINRSEVERLFSIFEANVAKYQLPAPPRPQPATPAKPSVKIFIGHGNSPLWRDLKDHLQDKHGLDVVAYEVGVRAGLNIRDVLDDMLTKSSFALLVLTAEDTDSSGALHARENVIHELGLFQGRLGWRKAIALLEEDLTEFSNIHGLQQIRFHKGNIQETFGEIIATVKREFPDADKE